MVKKDEIRTKIIIVASKIFTRYGFKKTTMEEIAMATRKGKSSIYYYFSSKEDIFRAVVEMEAEELKNDLMVEISGIEDPIEQLKAYILFRMHKIKTLSNFYAALKSDYLSHLEFIEKIRRNYDKNEIKIVTEILQKGIKQNKFVINKDHGNIEDRLDNIIRILFYGLVKR